MLRPSSLLNFGMNNAQKEVCFFFIQDIKKKHKTKSKKQKKKKIKHPKLKWSQKNYYIHTKLYNTCINYCTIIDLYS